MYRNWFQTENQLMLFRVVPVQSIDFCKKKWFEAILGIFAAWLGHNIYTKVNVLQIEMKCAKRKQKSVLEYQKK